MGLACSTHGEDGESTEILVARSEENPTRYLELDGKIILRPI